MPGASRCRSSLRDGSRPNRGSTPSCSRSRWRRVREWMDQEAALQVYRFAIEDLYRQQEHVLDESGERLMSLASRLASAPNDAYWALSTADAKFPTVTLTNGETVTVSYGQYRAHPGDAARAGRPRKGVHRAARHLPLLAQHLRRFVQRRLSARLVLRHARAATRARSKRRSTATTSRPPSSRT